MEYSDTTASTAVPAHVDCVPPPRSSAAFWNGAATGGNVLTLTVGENAIVDVDVEFVMADGTSAPSYGSVGVSGATAGFVYYMGLDGAQVASSQFITVGKTQI
jgi:hypothetical protein